MTQKVFRNGHSLSVTVPSEFVQALGIQPGQDVKLTIDMANATLIYKFESSGQLQLLPSRLPSE